MHTVASNPLNDSPLTFDPSGVAPYIYTPPNLRSKFKGELPDNWQLPIIVCSKLFHLACIHGVFKQLPSNQRATTLGTIILEK